MNQRSGAEAMSTSGKDIVTRAVTKPLRADARRNQARVLEAAEGLLATYGAAVSFDDIAREAGVGIGTVYRHIPTKEELFRTVVVDGMRRLATEARTLIKTTDDPTEAFYRFFQRMAEQTAINKALCEAFEDDIGSLPEPEAGAEQDFLAALGELLTHAQRAGGIRDDVDAADVRAMVVGAVMMERIRGDLDSPGRMIAIVSASLATDRPAASPTLLAVTKPQLPARSRNETPESRARCEVCGDPLQLAKQGRPARFCGAACRQAAHRRRHAAG